MARGNAGRAALSARFISPGGASRLQRLPAAPAEAAGGGGGARALCPGTARWSGAVADCGGDAGGCTEAPGGDHARGGGRGTGPDPGPAARGSSEAAGTNAADEVDRRGFAKIPQRGERYGGAVRAGDGD